MTAVPMKRYFNASAIIIFGCELMVNCLFILPI